MCVASARASGSGRSRRSRSRAREGRQRRPAVGSHCRGTGARRSSRRSRRSRSRRPRADRPLRFPVQDVYVRGGARIPRRPGRSGHRLGGRRGRLPPSGARSVVAGVRFFGDGPRSAGAGECPGLDVPRRSRSGAARSPAPRRPCAGARPASRRRFFWLAPEPLRAGRGRCPSAARRSRARAHRADRARIDSSTPRGAGRGRGRPRRDRGRRGRDPSARPIVIEPFRVVPELGRFVLCRGAATSGAESRRGREAMPRAIGIGLDGFPYTSRGDSSKTG